MSDNYILNGKTPVKVSDFVEWAKWFEANRDLKIVKQTTLPGDIKVSTVFLGLDHSWGGGPPLLFETMVFGGEHDQYCERYTTWDEAEAGHQKAIELIYA